MLTKTPSPKFSSSTFHLNLLSSSANDDVTVSSNLKATQTQTTTTTTNMRHLKHTPRIVSSVDENYLRLYARAVHAIFAVNELHHVAARIAHSAVVSRARTHIHTHTHMTLVKIKDSKIHSAILKCKQQNKTKNSHRTPTSSIAFIKRR